VTEYLVFRFVRAVQWQFLAKSKAPTHCWGSPCRRLSTRVFQNFTGIHCYSSISWQSSGFQVFKSRLCSTN